MPRYVFPKASNRCAALAAAAGTSSVEPEWCCVEPLAAIPLPVQPSCVLAAASVLYQTSAHSPCTFSPTPLPTRLSQEKVAAGFKGWEGRITGVDRVRDDGLHVFVDFEVRPAAVKCRTS